jgi:hypothetical protein
MVPLYPRTVARILLKRAYGISDKIVMKIVKFQSTFLFIVILSCLILVAPVKAQQYSFRFYGSEDGLTNLAVNWA